MHFRASGNTALFRLTTLLRWPAGLRAKRRRWKHRGCRLQGRRTNADFITIPEKALGEMSNLTLADGNIKVSPIAICVDTREMQDYPEGYIKRVKISFKDGTEYVVVDENVANHMFAVGHTDRDVTFMFNRMIDVNEIASVILDGDVEFRVS